MSSRARKRIYLSGRELAELRASLETVLESHDPSTAFFAEHQQCLDRLFERPCDLLVIDLQESEEEAMRVLDQVRRHAPWTAILALVGNAAVASAVRAVKAGACDCLEKPLEEKRLHEAVELHLKRIQSSPPRPRKPLTHMEVLVLERILAGKTSRDIAAELHRSKRTIDVHRKNLVRKLGASGPVDLIKRALGMGFSDASEPDAEVTAQEPKPQSDSSQRPVPDL